MSENQYNYKFKESKTGFKAGKSSSAPPGYEEAVIASSEISTTIGLSAPSMNFPESGMISIPPEVHEINIGNIPVKTSTSGVKSHDALLNKDSNLLYSFFLYHNTAPKLFVDIKGHHTESTMRSNTVTNSDGESVTETVFEDVDVVDFNMSLDASEYICPAGILHLTSPSSSSNQEYYAISSINQLFEKYVQSTNNLKEISLEKVIQWEFEELTRAILYSIRSQGYRDKVNISYRRENYKVKVISESKVARIYHDKIMSVLCVLTCCCLIFWPIAYMYKEKFGENFKSTFKMAISTKEWYYRNISSILCEVESKYGCRQRLIGSSHGSSSGYYSSI